MTDYKDSGVDIQAGDIVKLKIADIVASTYTDSVLTRGGEFAGVVRLNNSDTSIAVSIDGVGTKIKIAILANTHNTIGEDLVNHCVNDIAVTGSNPICFVDYISIGKLDDHIVLEIIEGLSRGCLKNNIPLIGGETAQMPGLYKEGEYDLAGAIIGTLSDSDHLPRPSICEGDIIIGFESNGLHTNGYSLVRKIIFEINNWNIDTYNNDLGCTWGEELLKIHISYMNVIKQYRSNPKLKGFSHITGGGIPGNLSRIIPKNLSAVIWRKNLPIKSVFQIIADAGQINDTEMYNVFNMGIGLIAISSREMANDIIDNPKREYECWIIGEIVNENKVDKKIVFV